MRRILSISLILFAAFLLVSCSDDDNGGEKPAAFDNWNDPKSPNYKPEGYNPVLGEWQQKHTNSKYIFTSDFKLQEAWLENGEWKAPYHIANYIINDKAFLMDRFITYPKGDTDIHNYSISPDGQELTIEYPGGGTVTHQRLK